MNRASTSRTVADCRRYVTALTRTPSVCRTLSASNDPTHQREQIANGQLPRNIAARRATAGRLSPPASRAAVCRRPAADIPACRRLRPEAAGSLPFISLLRTARQQRLPLTKFCRLIKEAGTTALDVARQQVQKAARRLLISIWLEGVLDAEAAMVRSQPDCRRAGYRPCTNHDRLLQNGRLF